MVLHFVFFLLLLKIIGKMEQNILSRWALHGLSSGLNVERLNSMALWQASVRAHTL
jgi:hypothetical protein